MAGVGSWSAARAADLCVNPAGTGGCHATIQGAVTAAGTGDRILIAAGTYTENVAITGKVLTFVGSGASGTVVDGNHAGRVFSTNTDIALSDITLQNGYLSGAEHGGGIYTTGAMTLANVSIISNTVVYYGGGAYASGATVINGGLFRNNQCTGGGGNCSGGALYATSRLNVSGTQFISNTGHSYGGAVYGRGAAEFIGGLFEANACQGTSCSGGAMFTFSTLALVDTAFVSNTCGFRGGSIYANGAITIERGRFVENSTVESGGALYTLGAVTMTDTNILSNTAANSGGGAYIGGASVVNGGLVQNNHSLNIGGSCSGGNCAGGGLFVAGTLQLTGTHFISNTAVSDAGGLRVGGSATLNGGLFLHNRCTASACRGGGMTAIQSGILTGTQFFSNTALGGGGGLNANSGATLSDVLFQHNAAGEGGGLVNYGVLTVNSTEFLSNTAVSKGGAVHTNNSAGASTTLNNVTAINNDALAGGAVYSYRPLTVTGGIFVGNVSNGTVDSEGGGAMQAWTTLRIEGAQIRDNQAQRGGGIYQYGDGGQVINSLLERNFASVAGAGYYRYSSGATSIVNSTVVSPSIDSHAAIFANGGTLNVTNTIVTSYTIGIQRASGTVTQDYNLFYGVLTPTAGTVGSGSHVLTDTNPLFVDPLAGDYRLTEASPALDAGDASVCPSTDLRGAPRIPGDGCDIGAYEWLKIDVSLSKQTTPVTDVAYRGLVTYTLVLSNSGTITDTSTILTDVLPAGAGFARWIDQPAGALAGNGVVTWTGMLTARQTVTLAFAITNTANGGAIITNTAFFSGLVQADHATAHYTATANLYPSESGNWSQVFASCAPGCKRVIPAGITVTLDIDITLDGDFEIEPGAIFVANGKTVTLTGDQPQRLTGNPFTFYNLVIDKTNKTDTVTIDGKLKVTKKITLRKGSLRSASEYEDVEIAGSGVLTLTSPITVTGHFTNAGEFYAQGNDVRFAGTEQQLRLEVPTTFANLEVMTGTTLVESFAVDNATVDGVLANHGTIRKTRPVAGVAAYAFGLAGGHDGAALAIQVSLQGTLSELQVERIDANHPNAPASVTSSRYWTITPTGSGYSATLVLPHGGVNEPFACRYGGATWQCGRSSFDTAVVTQTNISAFSAWTVYAGQATSTTVATSATPVVRGQPVTFTVTVTPTAATGDVQFFVAGVAFGPAQPLAGGAASLMTSTLPVGMHVVTATYAGGQRYLASTAAVMTQVVDRAATSTEFVAAPNPSPIGQSVTFTATVAAIAPGAGFPSGVVTFTVGGLPVAAGLSNGVATYSRTILTAGDHAVTAAYGGDSSFAASGSAVFTQTVEKLATLTTLVAVPTQLEVGEMLDLTATVVLSTPHTQGGGGPTGVVEFLADGVKMGSAALSNGQAHLGGPVPAADTLHIVATYLGDTTYAGSGSNTVEVEVVRRSSTTTLTSIPNPSRVDEAVVFSATVVEVAPAALLASSAVTAPTPGGQVIFAENGVEFGRSALVEGVAHFTNTLLPEGDHSITAEYLGDDAFAGSTSDAYQQVVVPILTAVNDATGTLQGHPATIPVLANDHDPAGGGLAVNAVTQPAHGSATIDPGSQAVTYTPDPAFSGVDTFTYTAQDTNGNNDEATVAVVVAPAGQSGGDPSVAPVDPTQPGQAVFAGTQTTVTLQTPAGVYTGTLGERDIFYLVYTPIITPTGDVGQQPGGLRFGNFVFHLEAYLNGSHLAGLHFGQPVTLTIAYDPALLGGLVESTLTVYYWDATTWAGDGITVLAHDTDHHVITIRLEHLSELAFFAGAPTVLDPGGEPDFAAHLYLPTVAHASVATSEVAMTQGGDTERVYLPVVGR